MKTFALLAACTLAACCQSADACDSPGCGDNYKLPQAQVQDKQPHDQREHKCVPCDKPDCAGD